MAVLRFISAVVSVYMIILVVRILMTWFGRQVEGRPVEILMQITDPYLNVFRRMRFLRVGAFDFSPVVAIITLSVVNNIIGTLAVVGSVTLGFVLGLIVSALTSAATFLLGFFLVLTAIRIIGYFAQANTVNRFWMTLDHILQPLVYRTSELFRQGGNISYRNGLFLFGGATLTVLILGNLLLNALVRGLMSLPV